jgi:hypothetical protein
MPRTVFSLFLSSTSEDLAPCRAKVREMIERMRQTTIAMETFGAKPKKPLQTCREEVQKCDALIVIVGHRYGWIPTREDGGDGRRSITWWEVQWALDGGKPVYAFLLDPRASWTAGREQDRLITAHTTDEFVKIGRAVELLQEFREFLDEKVTRDLFTSPEDLGGKVATSVHEWLLEQAVAAGAIEKDNILTFWATEGGYVEGRYDLLLDFVSLDHEEDFCIVSRIRIRGNEAATEEGFQARGIAAPKVYLLRALTAEFAVRPAVVSLRSTKPANVSFSVVSEDGELALKALAEVKMLGAREGVTANFNVGALFGQIVA